MPSLAFNPRAWYWLVGGDTAQAWSSAAGAYVTAYPADRVTHIDSEASLAAVLAAYGLPGPVAAPVGSVTPRQARLALQQAGLLDAVTAWIASADATTQIEWEFALEVRRDWPPIAACSSALGLSEAQLDGLFALAVTL